MVRTRSARERRNEKSGCRPRNGRDTANFRNSSNSVSVLVIILYEAIVLFRKVRDSSDLKRPFSETSHHSLVMSSF